MLIHGINKNLSLGKNITDIYQLTKVQGFKGGLDSGYWGGLYGISLANKQN